MGKEGGRETERQQEGRAGGKSRRTPDHQHPKPRTEQRTSTTAFKYTRNTTPPQRVFISSVNAITGR